MTLHNIYCINRDISEISPSLLLTIFLIEKIYNLVSNSNSNSISNSNSCNCIFIATSHISEVACVEISVEPPLQTTKLRE